MPNRTGGIRDAGRRRHVGERAVAVVVEERVAGAGQSARAALDRQAAKHAVLALAELRQGVEAQVDVVATKRSSLPSLS